MNFKELVQRMPSIKDNANDLDWFATDFFDQMEGDPVFSINGLCVKTNGSSKILMSKLIHENGVKAFNDRMELVDYDNCAAENLYPKLRFYINNMIHGCLDVELEGINSVKTCVSDVGKPILLLNGLHGFDAELVCEFYSGVHLGGCFLFDIGDGLKSLICEKHSSISVLYPLMFGDRGIIIDDKVVSINNKRRVKFERVFFENKKKD